MPRQNSGSRIGVALAIALLPGAAGAARLDGLRLIGTQSAAVEGDAYQRGRALLAINDVPGALAAFRQALTDHPQSIDALNGTAVAYDRLGRYDLSRTYYETALAIDPDAPVVLNNFGYSLYLQGNYSLAIDRLVAARNGPDAQASAAAARTLALIAAMPRAGDTEMVAAPAVETAAASARIEQTSEGEQRLVFGTGAGPEPDRQVASLATPRPQPAAPMQQVAQAAQPAVAMPDPAFLQLGRGPSDPPVPAAVMLVGDGVPRQPVLWRSPAPARSPAAVARREAALNPLPARVRREARWPALLTMNDPGSLLMHAEATTLPVSPDRAAAAFVSDDERLNAFAERMQAFQRGRMVPPAGGRVV